MPHHQQGEEEPTAEQVALRRVKSLIKRIHEATGAALREIAVAEEMKSQRWRCSSCGERHQFSRLSGVVACGKCVKCGGESWIAVESW